MKKNRKIKEKNNSISSSYKLFLYTGLLFILGLSLKTLSLPTYYFILLIVITLGYFVYFRYSLIFKIVHQINIKNFILILIQFLIIGLFYINVFYIKQKVGDFNLTLHKISGYKFLEKNSSYRLNNDPILNTQYCDYATNIKIQKNKNIEEKNIIDICNYAEFSKTLNDKDIIIIFIDKNIENVNYEGGGYIPTYIKFYTLKTENNIPLKVKVIYESGSNKLINIRGCNNDFCLLINNENNQISEAAIIAELESFTKRLYVSKIAQ